MKSLCRWAGIVLLLAAPGWAQTVLRGERLPPNTFFYLLWRGQASIEAARSTNSLLRLWADPEFAPARDQLLEQVFADAEGARKVPAGERSLQSTDRLAHAAQSCGLLPLPPCRGQRVVERSCRHPF